MAAKSKNVDIKSRRCPHCQGTELVCRLHGKCCDDCEHKKGGTQWDT